ncbi:unnamed protein product [Withania somnifera]
MMKDLLQKRLSAFYNSLIFSKQDLWGNSDAVVIHSQQATNPNSVSSKFYLWLVGEELDDTTAIFTPFAIYFFSTRKNYFMIRSLCCCATLIRKIPVSVQLKTKNDDGFSLIDATIRYARLIRNNKEFNGAGDEDRSWPFVVGYIEGECPMSKLFSSCLSNLEPTKFRAVSVNSAVGKMINTGDQPNFGFFAATRFGDKSAEFVPPRHIFSPPEKEKGLVKTTKNLKDEEQRVLHFYEKYQSPSLVKENNCLESKFERIGLSGKGRSNLGSEFVSWVNENPLPTNKTNENVSLLMRNLNLSSSSSSGKQDKLRLANILGDQMFKFGGNCLDGGEEDNSKAGKKDFDQEFKFGANILDGKERKLKEISKNGDQVFNFGASKLDGKYGKSMEGNTNGDQPFKFGEGKKDGDQLLKFGEGKKDCDQLFKLGEGKKDCDELFKLGEGKKDGDQQFKIGGKRGRSPQPQLMEENKGAKDVKLLTERLTAFYSSWRTNKEEQWRKADVLVITTQSVEPVDIYSHPVSSSFLVWLLDDEFPETTAVFTDNGIEFLCTNESFFRLRTIGIHMTMVTKVTVSVQLKKRGEQCFDWLRKTLCQVNAAPKSGANWCPLVVGCISGECMEIGVLSRSKMFEVAFVDNALINLLELGNFEKPESFAAQQSTLPKQFQRLSLGTFGGAKTANAVSFVEMAKMKSMDDNYYVSQISDEEMLLLEKLGDTLSSSLTDDIVDNGGQVEQLEEDNSSRMFLEIKEGDMDTSITEASAEEKLFTEEQNMLSNSENSPLPQVEECGEQSRPTAEGGMDYSVQPTDITDAAVENSLPDDNNGSPRKDSVGSDREDDDWTLVERGCEGKETEVAERVSWKRWFMDKTGKSFGLKDEASDEAPSKRTRADA